MKIGIKIKRVINSKIKINMKNNFFKKLSQSIENQLNGQIIKKKIYSQNGGGRQNICNLQICKRNLKIRFLKEKHISNNLNCLFYRS